MEIDILSLTCYRATDLVIIASSLSLFSFIFYFHIYTASKNEIISNYTHSLSIKANNFLMSQCYFKPQNFAAIAFINMLLFIIYYPVDARPELNAQKTGTSCVHSIQFVYPLTYRTQQRIYRATVFKKNFNPFCTNAPIY